MNKKGVEVVPRFCFKKKISSVGGQEQYDVIPIDKGTVTKSYYDWSTSEIVRDMKEEMLYVSEEVVDDRACENLRPVQYELPDGKTVELKAERIKILEKFFQPN